MYTTSAAAADRAAQLGLASDDITRNEPGVAAILSDLADYIGGTAGALGEYAIDEIAYAYLAGARAAAGGNYYTADLRRASSLARPILAAINRGV